MPLWKIHHPAGAYSTEDKQEFSEAITRVYDAVPIPRFYVVVIFEEVAADSFYVGGASHPGFVRIQIDQMARTLPGPVIREWWVRNLAATADNLPLVRRAAGLASALDRSVASVEETATLLRLPPH